jgi:hypothetical protein
LYGDLCAVQIEMLQSIFILDYLRVLKFR